MFYFRLTLLHLLLRIILPHCALNIVLVRHLKMTKIAVLLKWRWRSTEVKVSVHSCRLKLLLLLIHPSEQKMQVKTNSQSK